MKKLLALILITGSVWAEPTIVKKEVVCDRIEVVLKVFSGAEYQEKPIWLGSGNENEPLNNYSLFVNQETKTWTIIQFNKETACVLGAGEGFNILSKKSYI